LRSLGYDVRPHIGGVHGPNGPDPAEAGNHLVLTVRGLPTDENPSGTWYLDAGLGDEWFAALADVFELRFDAIAPEARDRLWDAVLARHRVWETRGGQ
jgi:arylamine N-acetyltransferase